MADNTLKKRIWEIDAARGIGIICVLIVHFCCLFSQFGPLTITWSPFFYFIKQYAGSFFVFLSGISACLGSKSVKRGLVVFGCGMILTACTEYLYLSGREGPEVLIQWGVLHLIGFAMILYPLIKKLPWWAILPLAAAIIIIGYYLDENVLVTSTWLFPLGLKNPWFYAWDWFPILPELGWFMCGCVVGKLVYSKKESLLPNWNSDFFVLKFFRLCGRYSLQIYMVHMIGFYLIAKAI